MNRFSTIDARLKLNGVADQAAQFMQEKQLKDSSLWVKFVDVFRTRPDSSNKGWRGEYWGKMMRGAVLVYQYTRDPALYAVLRATVKDLLTAADPDGRVSSYQAGREFIAWDIWCRKYVLLGCEYYLEICEDEALRARILKFIRGCADHIIAHIGKEDGKIEICDASSSWFGLNSSSVLEPMVRLYRLTGEQKYLDFAGYVVESGFAKGLHIWNLAYENKVYPYQYGVSKAYEMTSCFEGLLEYYRITKEEKYRIAVENFAKAVLRSEISLIGSSGMAHELFDHTRARQTVQSEWGAQETCVTVTWMKFCSRLLELTGDSAYADEMERSFYNAYLGSLNTEDQISPYIYDKFVNRLGEEPPVDTFLAFDSYSPLTCGKRGVKVGGNQLLPDRTYYGCCACIGAAGLGVLLKSMVMEDKEGLVLNFFERGTIETEYNGTRVTLSVETDYPTDGKVQIRLQTDRPIYFKLKVRLPGWSGLEGGYTIYKKVWRDDTVELDLPMEVKKHLPEPWESDLVYTDIEHGKELYGYHTGAPVEEHSKPEERDYAAYTRGPIVLAADSRCGRAADAVFDLNLDGTLCQEQSFADGKPCLLKMEFTDQSGEKVQLIDYSSAGKDWSVPIAAWLRTK